ncbi:HAUS augmin-like complex subunit 6 [Pholidichthys leucotaenia]
MAIMLQKENGQYLWYSLLGLGFQPSNVTSGKANINSKHINLGPNMFDKPNKEAFYIVTHFLLEKLNPTRCHEVYRHCWPVVDHKVDAEFRKVTCAWLKEIMDKSANAGSKVVPSLFLSPGGPKFTSLMLHLAVVVMLQEMKTFSTEDSWVPEAAALPSPTLDIAFKRLALMRARFIKPAVAQDRFLLEYQRRAQLLVKSIRDRKADVAKYTELLKRHSSDCMEEGDSVAEKMKKVRSLWSAFDKMMSTIGEEQNAVESVLKGDVDQYVLDGTDQVLRIPRCLSERIEQLPHQLSSGNVYEGRQLNLLCVMELMNHALQLLKEKRRQVSHAPKPQFNLQHLQEKYNQMTCMLQDLRLIRQKISKEEIPDISSAIRELEADWDKKWRETLKDMPLVSFLNEDPALGFLSPMAPLSFEPVAEESSRSVFSQYPAKLLDEKPGSNKQQDEGHLSVANLKSSSLAMFEKRLNPVVKTEAPWANTSLDWLYNAPPTPPLKPPSVSSPKASVKKTSHVHQKVAPSRTKTEILDMEYENLADQFADAVTAVSPSEGRAKDLELEGLLNTLQRDPFSARKQLPRTPESLIMDVKSSWRKAVEDKVRKIEKSVEFTDSITEQLTPFSKTQSVVVLSSDAPSQTFSPDITAPVMSQNVPPVCHQAAFLAKSTFLWDAINSETLDSQSGSSALQFSLVHETLPEMSSCDSLLSFNDESVDMKSAEDDELLIPSLKNEAKQSQILTPHCGDGVSSMGIRTPELLLSDYTASGLDRDSLKEPAMSKEATDTVFSLDLDELKSPSPIKKQEYSFPKLISFSPIDDMKF